VNIEKGKKHPSKSTEALRNSKMRGGLQKTVKGGKGMAEAADHEEGEEVKVGAPKITGGGNQEKNFFNGTSNEEKTLEAEQM